MYGMKDDAILTSIMRRVRRIVARGYMRRSLKAFCVMLACCVLCSCSIPLVSPLGDETTSADDNGSDAAAPTLVTDSLNRATVPAPTNDPRLRATAAVNAMTLEERVGQLVMAPLYAGTDPNTLQDEIIQHHIGSVLIIGKWTGGIESVSYVTDVLQNMASSDNQLLMATDQEGGLVQHLTGPGFDTIPSATEQGTYSVEQLRQSAQIWGSQLSEAGINVDLAPVLGTVVIDRASNAPIGALYRDFGLDPAGNATHGIAFIEGMRDAGVETSIKHYPGLGGVVGNTDFTASGIIDTTTTLDGEEASAFAQSLEADPAMVMMSLATYQLVDPNNPAAFSSTIIDGYLRGTLGFDGVVTSDSLSATALSGFSPDQLGMKLIEAGGDLACIGADSYVEPIVSGLLARTSSDADFAAKVTRSAIRVMTLKYRMGLAK